MAGYLGKYIARRLLAQGVAVRNLTGHPERAHGLGPGVESVPFDFDRSQRLVERLRGVGTLYNSYWVRFSRGAITHGQAVANSQNLIAAAGEAGVERVVHVSITNPSSTSSLPYFRGKAAIEATLQRSGLSYASVRPTVLFGAEDILVNNMAFLLRRWPLFAMGGSGEYRLQPVFVDDAAALVVELGRGRANEVCDAVGPETYSYAGLLRFMAVRLGCTPRLLEVPPWLLLAMSRALGWMLGDVLLTADELAGLSTELLVSHDPARCHTRFSAWFEANASALGTRYASELKRHYKG